jgi:transcriptional regulator with XRE-family HTH domain
MQTIGERLEEARKKKGLSVREAAEATKIRGDYLQKFEGNQFDLGLTEIYTRGFLRTYAAFLKLPADRILQDYSSLARPEARPRHSREIYGRLEVSTSTAASDEAAPAQAEEATPAAPPPRPSPARSRTGSSLPTGPDPAVIFRYTKWAAAAVGALVLLLIIKSLIPTAKPPPAPPPPAVANPPAKAPVLGFVAENPVQVTVRKKNPDESEGEVLFSGMLTTGEAKSIPRPGALFIEASAAENLVIEISGKRYNLGQLLGKGYQRGQLPAP